MSEFTSEQFEPDNPGFAQQRIEKMLGGTGVSINGPNPWDIQVNNPAFFNRILLHGSLGLGESWMNNWWDCSQLDEMFNRLLRTDLSNDQRILSHLIPWVQANLCNLQKQSRAFQVGEKHYDAGNDLYREMLDRRMVYTCGYWAHADNLDDAQKAKLNLVCRKLNLEKGMKVLDIGCGWGSFAKYAAENYDAEIVGITVSKEQVALGAELCKGLPVEIRLQDYRDVDEKFDAIVSLGMFEHVGHKNYRTYMNVVKKCLKSGAKSMLHTIGKNNSRPGVDPWIAKYIFPNGEIPSLQQISKACESRLIIEDVHNFGPDYDRTLMAWFRNFDRSWPKLKDHYSDRFYRIWKYYLHLCAGAFRARDLQLWQIVLSNTRDASPSAYRRPE